MKSDLSNVKVGDRIWTIHEGWTEVQYIQPSSEYPIITNFSYTIDGKNHYSHKHPSAFLEYPFERPIEKDTLVWFRDYDYESWSVGYYSHFNDGNHFCFNGSKKSDQTNVADRSLWRIVTTENPLT
jgi:hypothetical protein